MSNDYQPTSITDLPIEPYFINYQVVRESPPKEVLKALKNNTQIRNSGDIADLARIYIGNSDVEKMLVIALDGANKVVGVKVVSMGSTTGTYAEPRDIFRAALLMGATGVAIAHNHPSGYVESSAEDREVTKRLFEGAKILHLNFVDHVIVGANNRNHHSIALEVRTIGI